MARLIDSDGLLKGLAAGTRIAAPQGLTFAAPPDYLPPQPPRMNPKYGPEEAVPGLECSYGTFAYSYHTSPCNNVSEHSRQPACHNPVETPPERHHCDACGGDYCSIHADPAAHDCRSVLQPR